MLEDLEFDDAARPRSAWCRPASRGNRYTTTSRSRTTTLVPLDADGDYTGVYWTGREMALVSDLGPTGTEAIEEFRV